MSRSARPAFEADDPAWADLFASLRAPRAAVGGGAGAAACRHCGGSNVRAVDGNYECGACHSVVERLLDHGAEWRSFVDEGRGGADPARCGPPPNGGLASVGGCVVPVWRAPRNRKRELTEQQAQLHQGTSNMRVVQRYQAWNSLTHKERTLVGVFDLMSVSAATFGLPQCIVEQAKALYRRLVEQRILRGDSRKALIAACLYLACKSNQVPRSTKEVADIFGVTVSALTRGCRMFDSIVSIEGSVKSSAPLDFVRRFCSNLNMPPMGVALVRHVVARASELYVCSESTPPTLVGAAIQVANAELGMGLPKEDVSATCKVSAMTIARAARLLASRRADLLPPDMDAFVSRHGGPPTPRRAANGKGLSVLCAASVLQQLPHEQAL